MVSEDNGFLIERGDLKALTKAITTLVKDHKIRSKMGRSARRKIKENFTLSKMFGRVEREYSKLLK